MILGALFREWPNPPRNGITVHCSASELRKLAHEHAEFNLVRQRKQVAKRKQEMEDRARFRSVARPRVPAKVLSAQVSV